MSVYQRVFRDYSMISSYFTNKCLEHQVGTRGYIHSEDPIQIPWKSHQITISVGYIYCIYIYTLCNPILNNSLCNPIQIPVSTTVKTTTKASFSQVFLWVFPLFCGFFPHSKRHPRPPFIPRGAASSRPGTAVCGPRWVGVWLSTG